MSVLIRKTTEVVVVGYFLFLFCFSLSAGCGDNDSGPICGNGICEEGEDPLNCPEDCSGPYCGDGVCSTDESAATCPEDCYCGNGSLERSDGEECDGQDLGGLTCMDFNCEGGILSCTLSCRLDVTHCIGCEPICGDGRVDGDEMCDCGLDPDNLPSGCDGVNGEGNCSSDCVLLHYCGDGVIDYDRGEECDCGDDPTNLPTGCTAANGGPECDLDCTTPKNCKAGIWEVCDPESEFACCPDEWGQETECSTAMTTPYCLLPCDDTTDCYYNTRCGNSGYCVYAYCGPLFPGGVQINGECEVAGGGAGVCVPVGPAGDGVGICVENGEQEHGQSCDESLSLENTNQPRNVSFDRCNAGYCVKGFCEAFCDPETAYDDGDDCPTGSNCMGFSFLYEEDPLDPYDNDLDGRRWAEVGRCLEQSIDLSLGAYGCDLITGELTKNRALSCEDLGADLVCAPFLFLYDMEEGDDESLEALGGLIGACRDPDHPGDAVYRDLWELCDPDGPDVCPPRSECFNELASGYRCLPYCDTENDDCISHPELPSNTECESLSNWETSEEPSPTRLGVCVCGEGGCD